MIRLAHILRLNSVNAVCNMSLLHIQCWVIGWNFPLQNNPKNLDPSYKMDLDFLDCFGTANSNSTDLYTGYYNGIKRYR